ncbi:MAG: DNA polymerase [Porticoccaceae bacterium]
MTLLAHALHYAATNIPVFPVHGITSEGVCTCGNPVCVHPGKHPTVSGGFTSATTDPNQIAIWWQNQPLANIGIPTGAASGLYVVDIDKKHNGLDNYTAFENQNKGTLPAATLISATGGGGFHLMYGAPSSGVAVRCTTNLGGLQGVDFRGNGGYIVAPPSLHVSGQFYQWCKNTELSDSADLAALTPLPQVIVDLFGTKKSSNASKSNVPAGGRNDYLFRQACEYRRNGTLANDLYNKVCAENLSACTPPLGDPEVTTIVANALSYEIEPCIVSRNAGSKSPSGTGDKEKPAPYDVLMGIIISQHHEFWVDRVKKEYVTFPVEKPGSAEEGAALVLHYENWAIHSKEYRTHLSRHYRLLTKDHAAKGDLDNVITVLAGDALFTEQEYDTHVRTARHGASIFVDLSTAKWDVIEITQAGWGLFSGTVPVKFLRTVNAQSLPIPDATGTFDSLRDIFQLKNDDDYILLAAWMIYVLAGTGPYPILAIEGTAGSSKSTLSRHLRMLLDPRRPALQSTPNSMDDLYVSANNTHLIAIDNLSAIKQATSDLFCGISTGTGTSKRELYTNSDEVYFEVCKPILFNSINPVIESPDLADRSIRLLLQPIKRKSKESVDLLFDRHAPKIMGAMFTAISTALPLYHRVQDLPSEIRMLDFAQWAVAAGDTLATHGRGFVNAFLANHYSGNLTLLEENVLYKTVLVFITENGTWTGSPTALLHALRQKVEPNGTSHATFPRVASQLTKELNKGMPLLKLFGVQYSHSSDINHKTRLITLSYSPEGVERALSTEEQHYTLEPETLEPETETLESLPPGSAAPVIAQPAPPLCTEPSNPCPIPLEQTMALPVQLIDTTDAALAVLATLNAAPAKISLHIQTTGLNPHHDRLRLLQLYDGHTCYILDVETIGELSELATGFSQLDLVTHNGVFIQQFLAKQGLKITPDCTLLARHLLAGDTVNLDTLAQDYLPLALSTAYQASAKQSFLWDQPLTEQHLQCAARAASTVYALYPVMTLLLEERDMLKAYRIVKDAQDFVAAMELNGIGIDRRGYETMLGQQKVLQADILSQWKAYSSDTLHSSPAQLSAWLARELIATAYAWPKTPKGSYSTTTQDLLLHRGNLSEPAQQAIETLLLPLKKLDKLISAFGDSFLNHIDSHTNRIHASFNLTGTKTGRMSCSEPNLQQVPRQREYRQLFTAAPEHSLIIADYSQMELRVAAILAEERVLLDAYDQGIDTHCLTAALILGKAPETISKEERQLAKAINFGLLYGQGAEGLQRYAQGSYGVAMTLEEAQAYRYSWFESYPGIGRWHAGALQQARHDMQVRTPSGRTRYFLSTEYNEPQGLKPTVVYNTPVQGGAAEVLLAAMKCLSDEITVQGYHSCIKPIAVIHDEIVLEAEDAYAEQAKQLLLDAMNKGMLAIFPTATTRDLVEVSVGQSWADK